MIVYVIRFSISIAIFYLIYKSILEKEKFYSFNRFFLLSGLVTSLIMPLIPFNLNRGVKEIITDITILKETPYDYTAIELFIFSFFIIISAICLLRFSLHVYSLLIQLKKCKTTHHNNVKIILIKEKLSPFTFLNNLFINEEEYDEIPEELMNHELTHIYQYHSYDVLLIEFLIAIFWFHPFLEHYKKSIQLNHEFLADQGALQDNSNISKYQNLLYQHISRKQPANLASSLNFSLTKKRFEMMNKAKTKFHQVKKFMAIPVMIAVLLLCTDIKGVSYQDMSYYKYFTDNIEEQLATGDGVLRTADQYIQLKKIYNKMDEGQKNSVNELPIWLHTKLLPPQKFLEAGKKKREE